MTLSSGTCLGPYEILTLLGAGGMGEVYRARDTRLERTVAIKVLPVRLAKDPQFRDRFEREAKAIAALSHPHICTLHDVGHEDGTAYLVMEHLEGDTLARRLEKEPLPLDQALKTAIEVASALDAAHRAGIVHRDMKPGNIMLTKAGAKLLDFGLAKSIAPAVTGAGLSMLPTTPPNLTAQGTILGTFQYMAPEQLEGHEADARTDIFAFGAVVYEMLTGKKAFESKSQASLIGMIMHADPAPITATQPLTPPALERIVKKCLAKEPDERWQSAKDLCDDLRWIEADRTKTSGTVTRRRPVTATTAALVAAGATVAALITWALTRGTPAPTLQPIRLTLVPPPEQSLSVSGSDRDFVLSRDGTRLVYVSGSSHALMVRAIERSDAVRLGDITGARHPFLSPDGRWVGFFVGVSGTELKKVAMTGGAATLLCRAPGGARGASWGEDDTIIFSTSAGRLLRVSASGGEPNVLTTPDPARGETGHVFPSLLPGSRAVLFTVTGAGESIDNAQIAVLDLKSGQRKNLVRGGNQAAYLETGHVVYAVAGALRAIRFDAARLEVSGEPITVVDHVTTLMTGAAEFSVASSGALVYVAGGPVGVARSLAWVDRQGHEDLLPAPPRAYSYPRISPDGTRVALDIRDQNNDIWI